MSIDEENSLGEKEHWKALGLTTVAAGLGVEVEMWDTAGRQGAPDGRFEVGDRIGFVEVTTDANPDARAGRRAYDDRRTWHVDGIGGTYAVWIDPTVPVRQHDRFVPELVRAVDRHSGQHLVDLVQVSWNSTCDQTRLALLGVKNFKSCAAPVTHCHAGRRVTAQFRKFVDGPLATLPLRN